MGDRGRLVVPAELREHQQLTPGTPLILLETPQGIVLLKRDQALARLRDQLKGADLVAELLADRRAEAGRDAGEA
jgi:bifunctional DNA-binding transcriptional regulator/antitoxin component of YhaV-PrlF toxin-antitoxin module